MSGKKISVLMSEKFFDFSEHPKNERFTLKRKRIIFLILAFSLILLSLAFVLADGGYFPRPGYWVRPGQQRAIIFYEDNTETMIVTSGFQGNAKELVWIIPTPTKPEVSKASEEVFENIAKLAQPQYSGGYGLGVMAKSLNVESGGGVYVVESKQVDYYDVNVLVATDSQKLVQWFKDNNYEYPEEYAYVLNSYIQKGWFFTAVKVSPEAQGATEVIQDMKEGHPTPLKMVFLSDKIVFPLKISSVEFDDAGFKISSNLELDSAAISHLKDIGYTDLASKETTAKVIFNQIIAEALAGVSYEDSVASNYSLIVSKNDYNSRLTTQYCTYESCVRSNLEGIFRSYFSRNGIYLDYGSYNSDYTSVDIYVIADGKYEATYFYPSYANWVKKGKIEDLGSDDNGNPFLQPKKSKYFITHLYASIQKSQMDNDVYFKKADNNSKVNAGPEPWEILIYGLLIGCIIFVVWMLTPLGIMFIAACFILFLAENKVARVIGWIMQIFSFVVTILVLLAIMIIALVNSSFNYVVVSMLVSGAVLILVMLLFVILEIKYRKRGSEIRK